MSVLEKEAPRFLLLPRVTQLVKDKDRAEHRSCINPDCILFNSLPTD